jgi:hypothetical protein
VSFNVSHPDLHASSISASFGWPVRYARSFGEPRTTKQGEALGGFYKRTDVSFAVSNGVLSIDDVLIEQFVERSFEELPIEKIDQVVASGGACSFLIGVYSEGNVLCSLGATLLSRLAAHSVGLKLDFYGGPDNGDPHRG